MGCGGSKQKERFLNATRPLRPLIGQLSIPDADVKRIWNEFARMDRDGSGAVNLNELLRAADLEQSKFAERAFKAMDRERNTGEDEPTLDFTEFFVGMWNYCTMDRDSLVKFAFDLMDGDQGGTITADELRQLVAIIHGSTKLDAATNKIMRTLDRNGDGKVSFDEFRKMERRAQSLLFPVFNLQRQLSKTICGRKYWERAAKLRKKSAAGQDLLAMHRSLLERRG